MIDIAMLSYSRAKITELAIRELQSRTTTPHRLIVLDNGSVDRSPDMLRALQVQGLIDVLLFSNENAGVHYGFNQLLEVVQSWPHYICSDNDLIPCAPLDGKDWLQRLIELAQTYPEFGAITCRPHVFVGGIPNWDETNEIIEVPWAGAALRLMRTELVREMGGWQKIKRPSRDNEERWVAERMHSLGFKVGYARDIRCFHMFGEEGKTDPWGYPIQWKPEDHGHREIWPPVYVYGDSTRFNPNTWEPV